MCFDSRSKVSPLTWGVTGLHYGLDLRATKMVLVHKAMVAMGKGKTWDTEASEMKQNVRTRWSMDAQCSPDFLF